MRTEVRDTGCGIPEKAQKTLFTAFTQADAETTRKHGGSGLGLAICKRLIDLMGGTMGFTSVEGAGSTFWFEVPLRVDQDSLVPAKDEAPAVPVTNIEPQTTRVLVAEDNPVNQAVTKGFLKLKGLTCDIVENGQLAVEAVQSQSYDLILMDMEMPVMDGLEATRAIRALSGPQSQIQILALTAHAMSGASDRCQAAGMNGHVAKPIDKTALFDAIDAALERAEDVKRKAS